MSYIRNLDQSKSKRFKSRICSLYTRQNFSSFFFPEMESKCAGVHSRPLDSDDLRMIEDDLSKQLGSSPRDTEWDAEPSLEPFVTGFENGGELEY